MYLDFYQLAKAPFLVTPDPEFLFLSPSHKAALGAMAHGIKNRQGVVLIVGEVGVGKTTVLRSYLERAQAQTRIIFVLNSTITFADLLKIISRACGLQADTDNTSAWLDHFQGFLLDQQQQGHTVALIIDEAQSLPLDTLAQLHLLANLGTATERLLQIVLAGQPELRGKLQREELQHIAQSIVLRSTILPLTRQESRAYLYHCLVKVTLQPEAVFTPAALQRLVRYARGIPRLLNILCTNALIAGYSLQQKPIGTRIIEDIATPLSGKRSTPGLRRGLAGAASLALIGGVFWLSAAHYPTPLRHDKPPAVGAPPALALVPSMALTSDAPVPLQPPSWQPLAGADQPGTPASERQEPSVPSATTLAEPKLAGLSILPQDVPSHSAEDSVMAVPAPMAEPDEQSPPEPPSVRSRGARRRTKASRQQRQATSEQSQTTPVPPGADSGSTAASGRQIQATRQKPSASPTDKPAVRGPESGAGKSAETLQHGSAWRSSPSPYSRSDDTGSSW